MRIEIPDPVKYILKKLNKAGYEAYIVGGCVRDALIGKEPNDWDVTTSARPEQVKEIFNRTIDTGIKHGTVTVLLHEGQYEVTTYRIDGLYEDGRHPNEVTFTSKLEEDLRRRDFTINAMAYNDNIGLADPYEGLKNLEEGVIRAVGNPDDRFEEDALRIMRAVRFSAQLGFAIEPETYLALKKFAPRLTMISKERIRDELVKLITSSYPETFEHLYNTGITSVIMPWFDEMIRRKKSDLSYGEMTDGEYVLGLMQKTPASPVLRLFALLCNLSPEEAKAWMTDMRLDNATISDVCTLIKCKEYPHSETEEDIRRAMNIAGPLFSDLFTFLRADAELMSMPYKTKRREFLNQIEERYKIITKRGDCVDLKHLALKGNDLIAMGIKPGPEMGKILADLLEDVLKNPAENEAEYLKRKIVLSEEQK